MDFLRASNFLGFLMRLIGAPSPVYSPDLPSFFLDYSFRYFSLFLSVSSNSFNDSNNPSFLHILTGSGSYQPTTIDSGRK